MAISSYPRTIKNGQIATNGDANSGTGLMLWDSATNTYIAATPSTFSSGGGDATAANQATQISEATLSNEYLQFIDNNSADIVTNTSTSSQSTNSGILIDTFARQTLTASMVALTAAACKYVTLINLSTNVKFSYRIGTSTSLTLEAGYSVRINTSNASNLQIQQSTGEAQICEYIVTA
ncbi:MAG: hypothetical protein ACOYMA_19185 [Bacteroidia bacterium]